ERGQHVRQRRRSGDLDRDPGLVVRELPPRSALDRIPALEPAPPSALARRSGPDRLPRQLGEPSPRSPAAPRPDRPRPAPPAAPRSPAALLRAPRRRLEAVDRGSPPPRAPTPAGRMLEDARGDRAGRDRRPRRARRRSLAHRSRGPG